MVMAQLWNRCIAAANSAADLIDQPVARDRPSTPARSSWIPDKTDCGTAGTFSGRAETGLVPRAQPRAPGVFAR